MSKQGAFLIFFIIFGVILIYCIYRIMKHSADKAEAKRIFEEREIIRSRDEILWATERARQARERERQQKEAREHERQQKEAKEREKKALELLRAKEREKKALELLRAKERERKAREFERQKIYKEIWDKNWGKCELCGIQTKSIKDAHFEFLTDDGRLVFGELDKKYCVLLCRNCHSDSVSRGILELKENEFWDYHTKTKVNENIELYKHKTDFRDPSHPRYISPEVKQEVWSRDKGQCQMCGSREELQYDHIIPISKGGSNAERNIQLLCKDCNQEKSDKIGGVAQAELNDNFGSLIAPDGLVYEGEIKDGVPHGHGTDVSPDDEGKEIYESKKQYFNEKGRNTQEWNEKIRGNHLKKIVSHFGGEKIPYSCFSESRQLCRQIFDSKNDWNYIYYTIFMGLELGRLKEESDGLIYIGELYE